MLTIPTVEKQQACRYVKTYLKQYHDWLLVAYRQLINNSYGLAATNKELEEHKRATTECKERLDAIDAVKTAEPAGALILYYRFILGYSTQRTIEALATDHNINKCERWVRYHQRAALLSIYRTALI